MKKFIFSLSLVCFVGAAFASNQPLPVKKLDIKKLGIKKFEIKNLEIVKEELRRQACERSCVGNNGEIYTIEAHSGWFLSNDLHSYQKACAKASAALDALGLCAN